MVRKFMQGRHADRYLGSLSSGQESGKIGDRSISLWSGICLPYGFPSNRIAEISPTSKLDLLESTFKLSVK